MYNLNIFFRVREPVPFVEGFHSPRKVDLCSLSNPFELPGYILEPYEETLLLHHI